MINKQSMSKRFGAVALAAVMGISSLGAVLPAFADGEISGQVGIVQNDTNQTYTAYQIFKAATDNNGSLTLVDWGSNINSDAFLAALKADSTFEGAFADAAKAQDVADVLSGFVNDSAKAQAFAAVAEQHLTGNGTELKADGDNLTATSDPGYYLIKSVLNADASKHYYLDAEGNVTTDASKAVDEIKENETVTRFILQASGKQITIKPKSDKVTSDKDIVGENHTIDPKKEDATTKNIGDSINHDIKATVPSNIKEYKNFYFTFIDEMDEGLTLQKDSIKVVVLRNNAEVATIDSDDYDIEVAEDHKLQVTVNGIQAMTDVQAGDEITVSYTAVLNENAKINSKGNKNTFYVKYNNNPNTAQPTKDDESETPKDTNVVYTFTVKPVKVDKQDNTKTLEGAKFILKATDGEHANQYALVTNGKISGWTASKDDATTITSDKDGLFQVDGIKDGNYEFIETEAPAGYVIPAEGVTIPFTVEATVDGLEVAQNGDDGRLATDGLSIITYEKDADGNVKIDPTTGNPIPVKAAGTVSDTEASVTFEQENTKTTPLPSTGGMGTVAFTTVGVALMAGAVAITVKRRNQE